MSVILLEQFASFWKRKETKFKKDVSLKLELVQLWAEQHHTDGIGSYISLRGEVKLTIFV